MSKGGLFTLPEELQGSSFSLSSSDLTESKAKRIGGMPCACCKGDPEAKCVGIRTGTSDGRRLIGTGEFLCSKVAIDATRMPCESGEGFGDAKLERFPIFRRVSNLIQSQTVTVSQVPFISRRAADSRRRMQYTVWLRIRRRKMLWE